MVLLPDGRILLSGGATVDDKGVPVYHKDLRQLDTETMLWSKAKTTGGAHVYWCCRVQKLHVCYENPSHTETGEKFFSEQTMNERIFRAMTVNILTICVRQQASGYLHGVITP